MVTRRTDRLFSEMEQIAEDFVFNKQVAEVFDDMLERSVPFYRQVIESSAGLLDGYLAEGDIVCDLGCSTGSTLLALSIILEHKKLQYWGLDNSPAMIDKARHKAKETGKNTISFLQQDIVELEQENIGGFLLNYTLQFIRPLQRQQFLQRLYDCLRPGGILIVSEKTILAEQRLNRKFIALYHQFKKAQGYSDLEISRKREALENVLIPFSIEENNAMLRECGFEPVRTFFQWFNFVSFVAVKPE